MIASSVAAAPMVCPRWALIELTGTRSACRPRTRLSTAVSTRSFARVPVPWALTNSIASGGSPASRRARRIASARPRPSMGAVRWQPSAVLAWPSRKPRAGWPRARAWSTRSRTTIPAPSPSKSPLRRRSNGRTSSRVRDRSTLKPRITNRHRMSAPPASATSARPSRTRSAARPRLVAPDAHAVDTAMTGPRACHQRWSRRVGPSNSAPATARTPPAPLSARSASSIPPRAVPVTTATRSASVPGRRSPAWSSASCVAHARSCEVRHSAAGGDRRSFLISPPRVTRSTRPGSAPPR